MASFIQLLVSGLATGAIYALIAVGFTLLWQTSQTINFAQGEFVMLPAFFVLAAMNAGAPFWMAALIGIALSIVILGILFKIIIVDPMIKYGVLPLVISTIALSISGRYAAMVYLLRLNVGSPVAGVGYELNAIAAVIIGGTSLSGGKGSIVGTLVGACILQVLSTGLQLLGADDNIKPIVIGAVIVLAVILDSYRGRLMRMLETR